MSNSLQKNDNGQNHNRQSQYQYLSASPMNGKQSDSSGGLNPKFIISTLLRYKWLVLLLLIFGGTGAWFYADSLTPIYESKGTMLISAGDVGGENEISRIVSQTAGVGINAKIANELQVLQSRTFAEKVAKQIMENETGSPEEFPVLWRETEEDGLVPASLGHVTGQIRNNISFQLINRDSEVIEIKFKSSSPAESAAVINTAMDLYVETSTQQNRQAAEYTTEFLEKEREQLKNQLEEAELKLKEFMDNTGIVRMDNQAAGLVSRRDEIEAQLEEVELDLEAVELAIQNQEQELERIRPGLNDDFSNAVAPKIRSFQELLGEYERERYMILTRNPNVREREVTPQRLKFLDDEIENLKTEIAELSSDIFSEDNEYLGMESAERTRMVTEIQGRLIELRMQRNQYTSRVQVLQERKAEAERNFEALPNEMIQLARLQRDVEMNEELYLNVSKQYSDMSTWKETQYGYGRIIDLATIPGTPVSPNKIMLLIMGVILGGMISVAFIAVKEFFDNSINNVEQFKSSHLPMLAAVPSFSAAAVNGNNETFKVGNGTIPDGMVLLKDRSNVVSESIRRLKNNIIYQNADKVPKTIAVTSPEKGDGKSTIVCNLAVAFAEEGYKTLLIDSDFRRPKVHSFFGLSNKNGISNHLYEDYPLSDTIRDSELNNLKVVTAGSKLDRPESIASSEAFDNFLDRMEKVFDVIILDTPPYGVISDSTALLKRVDATVVVAKYRKTNRAVFVHTIEELERINANVSGLVLNDFNPKKEVGDSYGSGYYQSVYSGYETYVK